MQIIYQLKTLFIIQNLEFKRIRSLIVDCDNKNNKTVINFKK